MQLKAVTEWVRTHGEVTVTRIVFGVFLYLALAALNSHSLQQPVRLSWSGALLVIVPIWLVLAHIDHDHAEQ